jgi:ATP-dependent Clp protease ATP-binding subunit ClpA
MSSAARSVITRAGKEATREKARGIETRHVVLALLAAAPPDPVATLMNELGIDVTAVRRRLAKS